jgi:UDP-2-acetamido-2-deoxy-ribo-hexuluronate aminotransferase
MQFINLKEQYRQLQAEVASRMQRVLDHGQYIMGPEVAELESVLAAYTRSAHCITVASGTEAMLIALMARGVGPGDEVIVPAFTFAATAEVVVLAGATPVFADVDPETGLLTAQATQACLTSRTRAVIPVSLFGQCPDMDAINAIGERSGLTIIEDAAQSFGAALDGRRSCNLSEIGCTSFFPSKPLGCYGDGGAIFTDDAQLAQAMAEIRTHGQSRRYWHTRIGVGGRMDTLQCAIVLAKLTRFEWELERRTEIAARYDKLLAGIAKTVARLPRSTHVYAQYTVRVPDRDGVAKRMGQAGVPTAVHYPVPLNMQPVYSGYPCPAGAAASAQLAAEVLSLPMSADLDSADQDRVVSALQSALAV